MSGSIKVIVSLMSLWGKVAWHVFLNVVAQRMLGECCTRHHLEMWSVGLLYLEDVLSTGQGKEAFKHFEWMCEGVQPDNITFVCLVFY